MNFWSRYLIYLMVFFGGFIVGKSNGATIGWAGTVMALSGWFLWSYFNQRVREVSDE